MEKEVLLQQIHQQLSNAEIGPALDSLLQYGQQFSQKQLPDIRSVRARYLNAQRQYEVKCLISKQEFDLVFSQTLNGVQQLLIEADHKEIERASGFQNVKINKFIYTIAGFILTGLLIGIWLYYGAGKKERPKDEVSKKELNESHTDKPNEQNTASNIIHVDEPTQNSGTKPQTNIAPAEKSMPFFTVKIVLNADLNAATVYVDGQPATIIKETLTVKTLQVQQKPDGTMHRFELRLNNRLVCSTDRLIAMNDLRITMTCKL